MIKFHAHLAAQARRHAGEVLLRVGDHPRRAHDHHAVGDAHVQAVRAALHGERVDGGQLLYPLSEMAWDNFADHWLDKPEDNLVPFESDDYMQRMHPHNFGDSNFVIEYLREALRDEAPGFEPGGVKLDPRRQEPAEAWMPASSQPRGATGTRRRSSAPAPRAPAGSCRTCTPRSTRRPSRARSSSSPASAGTRASRSCGSTISMPCSRSSGDAGVREVSPRRR